MYNLSKAKTKDQEELEELRRLLMEDQSKLGFMGKYGKLLANPYGCDRGVPSCCGVFTSFMRLVFISLP